MSDEDQTGRRTRRPASVVSDPMLSSERRRRGVPAPVLEEDADITSPIDLLEQDLSAPQLEIVNRSRRNSDDPATFGDIVRLAERAHRREKSSETTNREIKKLLGRLQSAEEVETRLKGIEKLIGWGKKIAAAVVSIVIGSAGYVITKIQDRSELQGETTIRLQHIEDSINWLRDRDQRPRSRYDSVPAEGWPIPPLPSTKDKP